MLAITTVPFLLEQDKCLQCLLFFLLILEEVRK